jgi:hypothetical protein
VVRGAPSADVSKRGLSNWRGLCGRNCTITCSKYTLHDDNFQANIGDILEYRIFTCLRPVPYANGIMWTPREDKGQAGKRKRLGAPTKSQEREGCEQECGSSARSHLSSWKSPTIGVSDHSLASAARLTKTIIALVAIGIHPQAMRLRWA